MDLNMGINSKCNAGNLLRNNFIYLSAGGKKKPTEKNEISHTI